ncbi:MAG: hypothetical protein ACI83B_003875 [Sediminicola sp.]|jgi:hypothetical protein|tara:strand:+ start:1987 stop:2475 length:489 start_codon:yes stop_codon:yes gene_type:complete
MKNYQILFTFLIVAMTALFSCKNDDNSNNNDNQTSADQTTEIVQTGTWRITSFIDSGDDETSDFNGYTFTFNTDGSLVAVKGNTIVSGTWSVSDDSSNSSSDDDGNSTDDDNFNIFFTVPAGNDFEDLIDDWDFVSVSETTIALTDVSGGNGGTDFLTFQRN